MTSDQDSTHDDVRLQIVKDAATIARWHAEEAERPLRQIRLHGLLGHPSIFDCFRRGFPLRLAHAAADSLSMRWDGTFLYLESKNGSSRLHGLWLEGEDGSIRQAEPSGGSFRFALENPDAARKSILIAWWEHSTEAPISEPDGSGSDSIIVQFPRSIPLHQAASTALPSEELIVDDFRITGSGVRSGEANPTIRRLHLGERVPVGSWLVQWIRNSTRITFTAQVDENHDLLIDLDDPDTKRLPSIFEPGDRLELQPMVP